MMGSNRLYIILLTLVLDPPKLIEFIYSWGPQFPVHRWSPTSSDLGASSGAVDAPRENLTG